MQLFEMQGLLAGKCLPGDMKVNESLAEYLLRKINGNEEYVHGLVAEHDALAVEAGIMRQLLPDYISCPATDAAIAEIKAQGADTVADYHKVRVNALIDVDRKGVNEHRVSYMAARDVASNLRAGRKG